MRVHSSVLRHHIPLQNPRWAREARRDAIENGCANWIFQRSICGMPPSELVFNPWICSCSASASNAVLVVVVAWVAWPARPQGQGNRRQVRRQKLRWCAGDRSAAHCSGTAALILAALAELIATQSLMASLSQLAMALRRQGLACPPRRRDRRCRRRADGHHRLQARLARGERTAAPRPHRSAHPPRRRLGRQPGQRRGRSNNTDRLRHPAQRHQHCDHAVCRGRRFRQLHRRRRDRARAG